MAYIGSGLTRFNTADDLTVTDDAEIQGELSVDGAVDLNTSLNVDGTVTADGLTVDGSVDLNPGTSFSNTAGTNQHITVDYNGTPRYGFRYDSGVQLCLDRNNAGWSEALKVNLDTGDISFYEDTGTTPKLFWDASAESLGIGTTSPTRTLDVRGAQSFQDSAGERELLIANSSTLVRLYSRNRSDNSDVPMTFNTGITERMRIDSSGHLLVGCTSNNDGVAGIKLRSSGEIVSERAGLALKLNRQSSNGEIARFQKDGSTAGSIGVSGSQLYINSGDSGIRFIDSAGYKRMIPCLSDASASDNTHDWGDSGTRWDDIYATNGTIQTSDRNEKQDIASLTTAEMAVAARLANQFKTFRWIDSVTEKGDNARTHAGIIAQDVQQAFTDEGLDAGDYALFISTTWWETQTDVPAVEAVDAQDAVYDEEGNLVSEAVEAVEARAAYIRTKTYDTADEAPEGATERTRMGIRYPELLSFMQAYNDQRMTSIEARLDALEAN